MLRFLVKNERQINFMEKCIFHQTKRTFAKRGIIKQNTSKGKSATNLILKKIKNNIESTKKLLVPWHNHKDNDELYWPDRISEPRKQCDILVIGGGVIGSSIAYWIKQRIYKNCKVIVVEKDPTYSQASTVLSVGGLRQQFSLEENIEMSLFGAEFICNINKYCKVEGEPPIEPYFHPYGYLLLSTENGAETLAGNSKLQNYLGAKNILLTASKLKMMFPWLNTEDTALGCLGLEKEGWFDPWSLLCALKKKALVLGAEYVYGEAKEFHCKQIRADQSETDILDSLVVHTIEGEKTTIKFGVAVIACGAFSGQVAKIANVGTGTGVRSLCLPVEPRKRYVYCFHCPGGPGLNTPLTVDYSGTYFRREGLADTYICGRSPAESEEPSVQDLSVDFDYFYEKVWPDLANRVKAFESLKLKSSWAGFYEHNSFDKNGIIGNHPYFTNLIFATGFSGHGIQQAPAVGRAVSELIIDGKFKTIDLTKFGFSRLVYNKPMYESNIV